MDRRHFLQGSVAASATGLAGLGTSFARRPEPGPNTSTPRRSTIRFVATWPFGKPACEQALKTAQTGSMIDAIEQGIRVTEATVTNASVGIGGIPNANGQVELDACIMSGPGHQAGSVAGLQDIAHPISVARAVMERTPHVMLVGHGAREFALKNGFPKTQLLTDNQRRRWEEWIIRKAKQNQSGATSETPQINEDQHDTIAMLGVDSDGNLFGGCSTSGWGYKLPGRVGDSPIIGAGLYVDNEVGAAGATGLGENVMRFCGSFLVVEMMRNGASPTEACELACQRIARLDPKSLNELDINFVAMNKSGEFGAAGTSQGFKYSVCDADTSEVKEATPLSEKPIGPQGGNIRPEDDPSSEDGGKTGDDGGSTSK